MTGLMSSSLDNDQDSTPFFYVSHQSQSLTGNMHGSLCCSQIIKWGEMRSLSFCAPLGNSYNGRPAFWRSPVETGIWFGPSQPLSLEEDFNNLSDIHGETMEVEPQEYECPAVKCPPWADLLSSPVHSRHRQPCLDHFGSSLSVSQWISH